MNDSGSVGTLAEEADTPETTANLKQQVSLLEAQVQVLEAVAFITFAPQLPSDTQLCIYYITFCISMRFSTLFGMLQLVSALVILLHRLPSYRQVRA